MLGSSFEDKTLLVFSKLGLTVYAWCDCRKLPLKLQGAS